MGVPLAGRQMRVGLLTTAIFGDLSGYFFELPKISEIRPVVLYGDMLPLVGL